MVYAQQNIWSRHSSDFRCPRQSPREDPGKAAKIWLSNRENIILYIDANERIREGPLGKQLRHLGLRESFGDRHGHF